MSSKDVFLVTGAGGFLGTHFLSYLAKALPEAKVFAIVRKASGIGACLKGKVQVIEGDLCSAESWKKLPLTITHVFHLAAKIPYSFDSISQGAVMPGNLLPVLQLMKAAQKWEHLKQVVYSSSISVYGAGPAVIRENTPKRPRGLYGFAKEMGEEVLATLRCLGVAVACVRFSSLYGPGQYPGTVLPMMVRAAIEKREIEVYGKGRRVQDFLFCEDAARSLFLVYRKGAEGIFNIGSGLPTSMKTLARTINRICTGGRAKIYFLLSKSEGERGSRMDIRKAQKQLGFYPQISLEEGLRRLKKQKENKFL